MKALSMLKAFFLRVYDTLEPLYYSIEDKLPPQFPLKKTLFGMGGLLVLLVVFFGAKGFIFPKKAVVRENPIALVKVQKAKKEKVSDTYAVMGTIRGTTENDLRFEIEGTLARYNFSEGAKIAKGEIICSLDPKDSLSKTSYARSKYNSEKSIYYSAAQRMKVYGDLYKMKAISETKFEEARYETESARERMEAAESELELAQSNLSKTNLTAPSAGILAERLIQAGEFVTPHDVIAKFISLGNVNFEVDVPEKDVERLKVDMKVKITCDAYQDKEFWGKIKEIAPTVKEKTRTSVIKIEVPNDGGQLRSGMFARGDIYLMELDDAITVPQDSIISLGNETKLVPLVKPDPTVPNHGTVELRQVTVGPAVGKVTVISDGINLDELIVMETQTQLSDGLAVQFQESTAQPGR